MSLLVVLVRTHSPGNLGSAARAAKNFGASLALVDPRCDRRHPDALAFASGAEELLEIAEDLTFTELEQRVEHVIALSSLRGRGVPGLPPVTTFASLRRRLKRERVALVFGPERGGLTKEEMRLCGERLSIATSPEFPTMNLAQSVAATLALAGADRTSPLSTSPAAHAPAREVTRLLEAFRGTLAAAGFPGKGRSYEVVAEMEALLRRGKPTPREITLLLGALAAVNRAIKPSDRDSSESESPAKTTPESATARQTSSVSTSRARSVMKR
ncbi:MAG: RNA methyltransferase [Thermoanaerobaculia bacterium]